MAYHLQVTNYKPATLEATAAFFAHRPYRGTKAEKLTKYNQWLTDVSQIYGVECPKLHILDAAFVGAGFYTQSPVGEGTLGQSLQAEIVLPHYSVVSLFHEFRHHLQASGKTRNFGIENPEGDARAWSLSLFHTVKPRLFAESVKKGKVFYVTVEDLN